MVIRLILYLAVYHTQHNIVSMPQSPLDSKASIPNTRSIMNNESGNKNSILVVEDDIFISDLMARKLGSLFSVSHAKSVEVAKEILKKTTVNLIFLDVTLPGESGIDFLKELRKDDRTKALPVVVISNNSSDEDVALATNAGATEYMIKSTASLEEIVYKAEELLMKEAIA